MMALVFAGVVRGNRKSRNGPPAVILCRWEWRASGWTAWGTSRSRDCLEYSKPHYAGAYSAGADRGLGDRVQRNVDRLPAVPGGRGERRRRWLPGQALPHDHCAGRLSRSARRQGADRFDLSQPRHQWRDPALAGDPGGVARHPDHWRDHAVVGGREPAHDQAAAGVQAQHRGADPVCLCGARLARLWYPGRYAEACAHGPGRCLDLAVGGRLCRRMGASHEFRDGRAVSPNVQSRSQDTPGAGGGAFQRQVVFWVAAFVVIVLVLWLLSEILLPFIAGLAIAYLLTPLTDRIERLGVSRLATALLIITLMVMVFVLLILLVAPILGGQLSSFIENIPGYVTKLQSLLSDPSRPWVQKLLGAGFSADKSMGDLVTQGVGWLSTFLKSLWSGGRALVSLFSLIVVMPVVAFYLIYDWHRMIATVDTWIPVQQRETVRRLAREVDAAIAGFVRGQTAVCLILGSYYAVALTVSGLNFGLLIGLISGLITFIPYVGSMTGLILAVGVAVAQFWPDYTSILVVLGIFLVGQFLEGNVLAPKLVGESVGLHPVWLIFALLAFGYLFGFVGLLVAVPLAATIGVLARFALRRYLESSLYTGEKST